jgi:hypothetical protein
MPILGLDIGRNCAAIVALDLRRSEIELAIARLMRAPTFATYARVFARFGFGLTNRAMLLTQIYPFERFLIDGRLVIDWELDRQGKWQKRNRSLRNIPCLESSTK